jgi:hypothetical protein
VSKTTQVDVVQINTPNLHLWNLLAFLVDSDLRKVVSSGASAARRQMFIIGYERQNKLEKDPDMVTIGATASR